MSVARVDISNLKGQGEKLYEYKRKNAKA